MVKVNKRRRTSFSNNFITMEVKAFNEDGLFFLRIGQITEFFYTLGTQHSLMDQLKKIANTLHN